MMLLEDLEESNEAGIINERMEANVSNKNQNISALDSNIVSNRDGEQQAP